MTTTVGQSRSAITTYNFTVRIPDIDTIGYFAECQGLELSFEVYEYREGGNNDFVHHLPGRIMYPNLRLSRGLTNEDALLKWFWATHTQAEKKELTLTLSAGEVSRTWTFVDAFPVKWTGPSCSQGAAGVATESLEIAHAGLKMV
jgi:phage tail-like protein